MRLSCLLALFLVLAADSAFAQTYAPPQEGWLYFYDGDAAVDAPGFGSLDETWSHENGRDEWDGSGIGDGAPGGVSLFEDQGTTFLRLQETGDPRDYGELDPSNRKLYFTHSLTSDIEEGEIDVNPNAVIDLGVTLHFRGRIATPSEDFPLDDARPNGGSGVSPWPEQGVGYYQHESGNSIFSIKQVGDPGVEAEAANIAFGLDYTENIVGEASFMPFDPAESAAGLVLPNLRTFNEVSGDADPDVDSAEILRYNIFPVEDPTEFQEFWVTIREGTTNVDGFDEGTHIVDLYYGNGDSPLEKTTYGVTAADGHAFSDDPYSYIALGLGSTPRRGAIDVDFFGVALGLHEPTLGSGGPGLLDGDVDGDGDVDLTDFNFVKNNFGMSEGAVRAQGDLDADGDIDLTDFNILKNNFGAQAEAVPEPGAMFLALMGGAVGLYYLRRRA